MRIVLFTVVCFFINLSAQTQEIDSLKKTLAVSGENLDHIKTLEALSYAYLSTSPDTALKYALDGLQLARKINNRKGEAICIDALGNVYFHIGDNARALEYYLEFLKIKEELKEWNNISVAYYNIAGVYIEEQDYNHALSYLFKAKYIDEKAKDKSALLYDAYSLGSAYARMQKQDSALFYLNQSYDLAKLLNNEEMTGAILNTYGETYFDLSNTALAMKYYRLSIPFSKTAEDNEVLIANYYGLAKVFDKRSMYDSTVIYAGKALRIAQKELFFKQVLEISTFLSNLFKEKKQFDSAFFYQSLSIQTKDSLFSAETVRKVQNMKFQELQRQQTIEANKLNYRNKIRSITLTVISVASIIIAVIFWFNYKQKKKSNILLRQQKQKIKKTLKKLRSAQSQLIQSEKMASLGELTAGIAHEIQNPLNFVNNFSEVNKELVEELLSEKSKVRSERNEELENELLNYIKENEEKINHHGKRADTIVKNMLQHSCQAKGVKEPTDINALCDEYLRLAYHGLRAKDKNFKAEIKTDFDENVGKINIVPQDIGRVLLNLFNNAFYAVNEKKKTSDATYQPTVSVQTKKLNDKVEIRVIDNGNGIPQNIVDKIFQPFFTTKPAGEGTGLGLSLSYDIIKANGGEIKVESKEGEGSEFIIRLLKV